MPKSDIKRLLGSMDPVTVACYQCGHVVYDYETEPCVFTWAGYDTPPVPVCDGCMVAGFRGPAVRHLASEAPPPAHPSHPAHFLPRGGMGPPSRPTPVFGRSTSTKTPVSSDAK